MTQSYFPSIESIPYEGPESENALAFRYYDKSRRVLGKSLEAQLRPAVCYWHTFAWQGNDVFGGSTFDRPWHKPGEPLELALRKLGVAFEFFEKLGIPFFTFHDRDVAPEGESLAQSHQLLDRVAEPMAAHMQRTGVRLLWGTANLFSHPRYLAGAATNPNPEIFAYAAAQLRKAMEVTHQLGGENYVLWGGREGYETLLNTHMKRELDQLGRFLALVVEHKHKIGFKGTLLIEPKPKEPTKHQYDFDTAAVFAFLQAYGLDKEFKVNIEANHAILAGHSFQHEVAYALQAGIMGSIDMNRGDSLLGWDTDQFPNDIAEVALVMYTLMMGGGFTTGGMNFDAKLRRPSIDPEDIFHAHIGGLDTMARALLIAERMIEEGGLEAAVQDRYAGWEGELGQSILGGQESLGSLSERALKQGLDPQPRSGQQEMLENKINRFL